MPALAPFVLLASGWLNISPDASFRGWTRVAIPPEAPLGAASQWRVEDGRVVCEGTGGHEWLRYDRELGDFILRVEWRFTRRPDPAPRYNSGIFVRNSADGRVWHQAQAGSASGGYLFANTLVGGRPQRVNLSKAMKVQRVKPAGAWNRYEIRCQGSRISLTVNGAATSVWTACEIPRGYLGLEAEGYRIEFRNLRLRDLRPPQ